MKTLLSIIFTLTIFGLHSQSDTTQRRDWRAQFKKRETKPIYNMVPDSAFITVKNKTIIQGQVKSICAGNDSEWASGAMILGVIVVYSSDPKLTYCVLTSNNKKNIYSDGDSIKIKVRPLTRNDKYFYPRQLTCDIIKADVVCIAVD